MVCMFSGSRFVIQCWWGVSHAESWYPLNTDADGRTGYIDNDTVEKDDAQAKLNLKIADLVVITLSILCNSIVS